MRIAIATFSAMPAELTDDQRIAAELRERGAEVQIPPWDDGSVDWEGLDLVVIRSTWDYALRRDEFLAWADRIGDRLHNSPALIRWNSDKRYLHDLGEAGFDVVATRYVAPGERLPKLNGEVVVKPAISAGARDTGRFGTHSHALATELIEAIQASGRTAMVQPYQATVDTRGETAVLCIDGEPAHALRKRAVLAPDEVAPVRDALAGVAEVMYDPALVTRTEATERELEHARAVVGWIAERFAYLPLYARVDSAPGSDGEPVVLELEAIEPNFYLDQVPGTASRVADSIIRRATA